jgi:hypothetical protein
MLHYVKKIEVVNNEVSKINGILSLGNVKALLKIKGEVKMSQPY